MLALGFVVQMLLLSVKFFFFVFLLFFMLISVCLMFGTSLFVCLSAVTDVLFFYLSCLIDFFLSFFCFVPLSCFLLQRAKERLLSICRR